MTARRFPPPSSVEGVIFQQQLPYFCSVSRPLTITSVGLGYALLGIHGRGLPMKSIFVAAIIATACSGVALAGELKQDQKTAAPVIKGTVMNDAEMDKVTAGGYSASETGFANSST